MFARIAQPLGVVAAKALRAAELTAGVIGWLMAAATSALVVVECALGSSLAAALTCYGLLPTLGYGAALLFISILRRGLRNWAGELGLYLGLYAALGSGALMIVPWLVLHRLHEAIVMSSLAATTAALSLLLSLVCARIRPDRMWDAWLAFRRWLNGARDDGSRPNCVDCFDGAASALVCLCLAVLGAINPSAMIQRIASGAVWLANARGPAHALPTAAAAIPPWFRMEWPWLAATSISAAAVYVAFRRLGSGSVRRGCVVWLLAVGQLGGIVVGGLAFLCACLTNDGNLRYWSIAFAPVAALIAWECYRRRTRIDMWHDVSDPMFPR